MSKGIVILGGGESGVGAALLARQKGFDVFLSDSKEIKPKYKETLNENKIAYEEEKHSVEYIGEAAEVIKSPGIPDKAPVMQFLLNKGVPVISEIEFAARYTQNPVIAVSGSNGKSTTTAWIHHIFKKQYPDTALVGNIGRSFAAQVAEHDASYYACEVSSFQLDNCYTFKPRVAVLLNISPNHLDRYDYEMEKYIAAKFRIAQAQDENDTFIYNADDENIVNNISNYNIKAYKIPFSIKRELNEGAFLKENELIIKTKNNIFNMSIYTLALPGPHNIYNAMAAGIASQSQNIRKEILKESFCDFKSLEHRLEFVAMVHGIKFINDSKSTTVNSTWYALESVDEPVIWIAGGIDKGNDYAALVPLVKQKVKAIVCMGKDNHKIHEAFNKYVDVIVNTQSALEAVNACYSLGRKGDSVLLSPACASFDLFENFEDRGRQFKATVKSL